MEQTFCTSLSTPNLILHLSGFFSIWIVNSLALLTVYAVLKSRLSRLPSLAPSLGRLKREWSNGLWSLSTTAVLRQTDSLSILWSSCWVPPPGSFHCMSDHFQSVHGLEYPVSFMLVLGLLPVPFQATALFNWCQKRLTVSPVLLGTIVLHFYRTYRNEAKRSYFWHPLHKHFVNHEELDESLYIPEIFNEDPITLRAMDSNWCTSAILHFTIFNLTSLEINYFEQLHFMKLVFYGILSSEYMVEGSTQGLLCPILEKDVVASRGWADCQHWAKRLGNTAKCIIRKTTKFQRISRMRTLTNHLVYFGIASSSTANS